MTERNFAGFTTERANAGDMVHPSGARAQGAEPFSAEAWRGINDYADTIKRKTGTRSVVRPSKTLNIR